MTYERFTDEFANLDITDKIAIFNRYCDEVQNENNIYDFDEEFFENFFSNPTDAARAVFFGNIQSWSDDYIKFDGYGNLESFSDYDVEQEIEDYLEEIFDHESTWDDIIENEYGDEEDDEEEDDETDYN